MVSPGCYVNRLQAGDRPLVVLYVEKFMRMSWDGKANGRHKAGCRLSSFSADRRSESSSVIRNTVYASRYFVICARDHDSWSLQVPHPFSSFPWLLTCTSTSFAFRVVQFADKISTGSLNRYTRRPVHHTRTSHSISRSLSGVFEVVALGLLW